MTFLDVTCGEFPNILIANQSRAKNICRADFCRMRIGLGSMEANSFGSIYRLIDLAKLLGHHYGYGNVSFHTLILTRTIAPCLQNKSNYGLGNTLGR